MKENNISLVIPCYNEEDNLPTIFNRIDELKLEMENLEFILVDNGSTDHSKKIIKEYIASKNCPEIKAVYVTKNEGYGHGILEGLKESTGDYLAWTHADLQTDLKDIIPASKILNQNPTEKVIVKGSRRGRHLLDTLFTYGMSVVSRVLIKDWLSDINAQPKLFPRNLYQKLNDPPKDFSLDLYLLWKSRQEGYAIKTFPVRFNKRLYGEAKGGGGFKTRFKLIKRTFQYIQKLKRHIEAEPC